MLVLVSIYLLTEDEFEAAKKLMWACGTRQLSSSLSECSFTDLREDGQLSGLLSCGW